jgi:hypothetical protein
VSAARRHAQRDATADAGAAAGNEDDLVAQDVGGKNLHLESLSLDLVCTPHASDDNHLRAAAERGDRL